MRGVRVAQHGHQVPQVGQRGGGGGVHVVEHLGDPGIGTRQDMPGHRDPQRDGGDVVGHDVVQFPGHGGALGQAGRPGRQLAVPLGLHRAVPGLAHVLPHRAQVRADQHRYDDQPGHRVTGADQSDAGDRRYEHGSRGTRPGHGRPAPPAHRQLDQRDAREHPYRHRRVMQQPAGQSHQRGLAEHDGERDETAGQAQRRRGEREHPHRQGRLVTRLVQDQHVADRGRQDQQPDQTEPVTDRAQAEGQGHDPDGTAPPYGSDSSSGRRRNPAGGRRVRPGCGGAAGSGATTMEP